MNENKTYNPETGFALQKVSHFPERLPATLNAQAAADYMGYSRTYFYAAIRPELPVVLSNDAQGRRKVRYRVRDLDYWMDRHTVHPRNLPKELSQSV
jgi:predicted DNA-binding transcriptional regulator AlpA